MKTPRSCLPPHRHPRSTFLLPLCFAAALAAAAHHAAAEEVSGPSYWGNTEPATGPGLNILSDSSASFVWEGRRYELNATSTPTAKARGVLEEAISTLAPGLGVECFYRQTAGSWSDLAAAGLGDPGAALPAEWAATEMSLSFYRPPTPGCPGAAAESPLPVTFSADFSHPGGRRLTLRADSRLDGTTPSPGLFTSGGAEWGEPRWYFGVAFDGPELEEVVTALAQALDPALDLACQRRPYDLGDTQLQAYGFKAPQAPAGFQAVSAQRSARLPIGWCASAPEDAGDFELAWAFQSAEGMLLEIGASRPSPLSKGSVLPSALVGEGYVRWTDAGGTSYYVYGHPLNDGPSMDRDTVFALARQLDPAVALPKLLPGR